MEKRGEVVEWDWGAQGEIHGRIGRDSSGRVGTKYDVRDWRGGGSRQGARGGTG